MYTMDYSIESDLKMLPHTWLCRGTYGDGEGGEEGERERERRERERNTSLKLGKYECITVYSNVNV